MKRQRLILHSKGFFLYYPCQLAHPYLSFLAYKYMCVCLNLTYVFLLAMYAHATRDALISCCCFWISISFVDTVVSRWNISSTKRAYVLLVYLCWDFNGGLLFAVSSNTIREERDGLLFYVIDECGLRAFRHRRRKRAAQDESFSNIWHKLGSWRISLNRSKNWCEWPVGDSRPALFASECKPANGQIGKAGSI